MEKQQTKYKCVPSHEDYVVGTDGSVWSVRTGRLKRLRVGRHHKGYGIVQFRRDGRSFVKLLHRVMLQTFVGPCPPGKQACHNDGDPRNNRLSNLRWDTAQSNQRDRIEHGTACIGEKNHNSKLSETKVRSIRASSESSRALAAKYGVARSSISAARSGKTWGHVC